MKRQVVPATFSVVVAVLVALGACGGPATPSASSQPSASAAATWSEVLVAAGKEAKVVVSGQAAPDADKVFSDGFRKQFPGIQVEYLAMTSPEATAKLMTEQKGNLFSVDLFIHGTPDILTTLIPAGAVQPVRPFLAGPDVQDESQWLGGKFNFADEGGTYDLIFTGGVKVPLVYNPNLVQASAFTSYKDLLDPKWRGKIAMLDPRVAGSGQGMASFWYQTPELGKDYLKQLLTQQAVALTKDDRQLTDWVGRGEYPIAVGASDFTAFAMKAKGVPVESLPAESLKETSYLTAGFGSVAVMNRAPHPNATMLYLDWMLSKSGQEDLLKVTGYPSRRLDASAAGLPESVIPKRGVRYQDSASEATSKVKSEVVDYLRSILPG